MPLNLSDFTPAQPVGVVLANDIGSLINSGAFEENPPPLTLTWADTTEMVDNNAYNPLNWLSSTVPPQGDPTAPAPGDSLYMEDGTMDIAGGTLAGDTLNVGYDSIGVSVSTVNPTINLSQGADVSLNIATPSADTSNTTINVSDQDTVAFSGEFAPGSFGPGDKHVAININSGNTLDSGATLTASGGLFYSLTTISGDGSFVSDNMNFAEGSLNIQSNMIGTGDVKMAIMSGEIGGSVASGVSITLQVATTLTIDHPDQFQGTIIAPDPQSVNGGSLPDVQVNLQGLVADSYDLSNDLLTLYKGSTVVDTLNFNDGAASTFVGQGASGVVIGMNESAPSGVTALPLHM